MTAHTFDTISDSYLPGEDGQVQDKVNVPVEVKNIARRLTFVLFDEIIEDSPTQSRRDVFDPDKNKEDLELLNSIKANGIITPIIVRNIGKAKTKQGNREYALVAGHRRVAAGIAAGLSGADGYVTKPHEDHEMLTLVENTGRRELSTFEKGLSIQSLKERRDLSVRKLAEVTGLSKSYVSELIQALQSPEALMNIWEEGEISPRSVVLLKDHWSLFEKEDASLLLKNMRDISREQAIALNDQLNAGTPLKKALALINSSAKLASGKATSKRSSSAKDAAGISKDQLITALVGVFPRIKEKQARTLYDYSVVNGIQDPEIIWASALYVNRGGNINRAVELSKQAFGMRQTKSLVAKEVKLVKKAALVLKGMKKENKELRQYLQIIINQ